MTTSDDWRVALVKVQMYCEEHFKDKLKYSTDSLELDHGCPPPIKELHKEVKENQATDTKWNGKRVLWCYPAAPHEGSPLKKDEKIPVACLGTSLWCIIHALKLLKLEDKITNTQIENLKKESLQEKNGLCDAFINLGWANNIITNPNDAQGGDVGVIGYGDNLPHHWFIVAEEPHIKINNVDALNTWAASPSANGAGYDYWYKNKSNNNGLKRYWSIVRPFEKK